MKIYFFSLLVILSLFTIHCNRSTGNNGKPELTTGVLVGNPDLADAAANYKNYCGGCHGENLRTFVDRKWNHGSADQDLFKAIKYGYENEGMPAYDTTFTDQEINDLVTYIKEGIKNVEKIKTVEASKRKVYHSKDLVYTVDTVLSGLDIPWGMTFLPDGDLLYTERSGSLYRYRKGQRPQKVSGTPKVLAQGQGGLLDVVLHPDFENNQWIYLSYSLANPDDSGTATTAINRAKLNGNQLTNSEKIFEALPFVSTRHHYGSRFAFDKEGYLFFSVGDRGKRDEHPQFLSNHCGKIHRIKDDGSIPLDNPFVATEGAMPSIYSYGHRNPQGLAMHPSSGVIWEHEHGPKGGDEVNIIQKGKNYGWPVISYGINYSGTKFTDITEKEGMEQPELYWVPSIAPCGTAFSDSDVYPGWKGDLMVGSLRFNYIKRCMLENGKITGEEILLEDIGRVRNVIMGRDGYLYVAVEDPGTIYKIVPIISD